MGEKACFFATIRMRFWGDFFCPVLVGMYINGHEREGTFGTICLGGFWGGV